MIKTCVIGASGYTGAELVRLLAQHKEFTLQDLFVSANSADKHRNIVDLYPALTGLLQPMSLRPLEEALLPDLATQMDAIFLATPHQASHDWMPQLSGKRAKVFDLSGAFRLPEISVFEHYYGFAHQSPTLLEQAVYGLTDWYAQEIKAATLVAVPGCYPTASLYGLKPLQQHELLDPSQRPVINAVSGVSGAGRKAALSNSFCEVSLQAYGVLSHRHQPEISHYLDSEVIFTPHLGNFKRGILATITVKLKTGVPLRAVDDAYQAAYANNPLVRLLKQFPRLDDVVHRPFCDLHWQYDPDSGYLVIGSAIDNLLKGAASQALECANLNFGFAPDLGLSAGESL